MEELTLDGLLSDPQIPLQVIVPGDGRQRIRGTRIADVADPRSWIVPDSLVLTTGVLLSTRGDAAAFVRTVYTAQAAAVVFARGAVLGEPPAGLVDECSEHGLPLLALPEGVPFARLEEVVSAAVSDAETYRLRRRLWFQTDLLAVLGEERPLQALMTRMAQLVRGTAVLYEGSGRIAASVGEGPVRLMWNELAGRDRFPRSLAVGRYHVLAAPVVMRGSGYWLAVASRQEQTMADVGAPLLETAAQMLSAMRGARALSRAQDQARARSLLTLLAGDIGPERVPVLWTRLRGHGFSPRSPMRVAVATADPPDAPRARAELLEELHERAHLAGVPLVIADEPDDQRIPEVLVLAADEPGLPSWVGRLAAHHAVGVSEPVADLVHVASAFRDARMAMQLAEPGSPIWFEDVDLATWLVSGRTVEALHVRGRRHFAPLADRPDLVETLVAYLRSSFDVAEAARRLYLHPNTVRYRLHRIEELLDGSLTDPMLLTNLCLFLHVDLSRPSGSTNGPRPAGAGRRPVEERAASRGVERGKTSRADTHESAT